MSDIAIRVENLGKQYHIGTLQKAGGRHTYKSLRDSIADAASLPLRAARRLVGQGEPASNGHDQTFWALKDVSFDIKHGEIVGVIGRNGAGKSTLLKLLSRITEPTTGRVEIHGRIGSLLEVGTGFHPELSGRDNVYMNGAILGMKRAEIARQFDEIVAFAEVEKFVDTPVKHYSSGMYLRLAFAVAAHLQTEIMIVDEVLAVGDADFQNKCMGKMQDVSNTGRTVVFVSHNMDAILRLCSRSVLLNKGTAQLDSDTRTTLAAYKSHQLKQAEVINLRLAARPFPTRLRATIVSVEMISLNDSNQWSVPYGDQLGFTVAVSLAETLQTLELGISIFTITGSEITSNLSSHQICPTDLHAGQYTFDAQYLNLRLVPGTYYLQLGLRTPAGMEDFVSHACEFEVLHSRLSAKHMTDTFLGVLVPEVKYAFEHLAL